MALDQDEEYLDDDLDIDNDEFLELQQQALQATQRPKTANSQPARVASLEAEHLQRQQSTNNAFDSFGNQSSEYGEFDEEVLDAGQLHGSGTAAIGQQLHGSVRNKIDDVTQREQWRHNRFSVPSRLSQTSGNVVGACLPHRGPTQAGSSQPSKQPVQKGGGSDFKASQGGVSLDVKLDRLLAEKRQWELEKMKLRQEVKYAKEEVLGKNGELSILRSAHARQEKERERIINELKQQQNDREERHKKDLEVARKVKESLVTQNKFLDHEMSDNTWPGKKSGKTKGAGSATPKRQRTANLGDGFNDDEMMIISPSKSGGRMKGSTPRQGAKRKRDVFNDSPAQPLQFSQEAGDFLQDASNSLVEQNSAGIKAEPDSRFTFLQMLLAHRIGPGIKRTFEVLASFYLPSDSGTALSTLLLDKLGPNNIDKSVTDFPASVGSIIVSIWTKCLDEHYHKPIHYLVDLVKFILLNGTVSTACHLAMDITRVAQLTGDINILPRWKAFTEAPRNRKDLTTTEQDPDIDIVDCLELLTLTAIQCSSEQAIANDFWRFVRFDFISMLLRVCQRVDDIVMAVKLLQVGTKGNSLNFIKPPDRSTSLTTEQHVIDRLTSMLIEVPLQVGTAEPYDPVAIVEMRLEILVLLAQICDHMDGGRTFALHPHAFARVVRVMSDELTGLYVNLSGQDERSEVINHTCRIIFHITTVYSSEVDLQEKLRSQPGGVNKYLIALSRLAFSEGIYFERGIDEDVFDCAHEMLDEFVTPEEGELLRQAFVKDDK